MSKSRLSGFISWDGFFYAQKTDKNGVKYYKSKNVRFDNMYGITEECTRDEYFDIARKYAEVMN